MVRSEIVLGKKVSPQYSTLYVCNDKIKVVRLRTNHYGAVAVTVTGDVRPVCGLQFDIVGSFESLLGGGRDNGQ